MTDKEDEQLLEDASTLLMFANAAARQRSPVPTAEITTRKSPSPQAAITSSMGQKSTISPHMGYGAIASTTNMHHVPQGARLQLQTPYIPSTHVPHILASLDAAKVTGAPKPHLPHIIPGQLPLLAALQSNMAPFYPYSFPPPRSAQLGPSLPFPALKVTLNILPPLVQRPILRPETAQVLQLPSTDLSAQLPLQPVLPVKGNFQTHRRTQSGGQLPAKIRSPGSGSPVASTVGLSRGINVETGKRNTDNAMIAAAALAAAADIPLPLKSKKEGRRASEHVHAPQDMGRTLSGHVVPALASHHGAQIGQGSSRENGLNILGIAQNISAKSESVASAPGLISGQPEQPKQPLPEQSEPVSQSGNLLGSQSGFDKNILNASDTIMVKNEDSVTTEPEEDNRTDDEPEPRKVYTAIAPKADPALLVQNIPKSVAAPTSSSSTVPVTAASERNANVSETQVGDIKQKAETDDGGSATLPPPLDEYKVDPDSGLIGCICGIEEDDGFTIQCDLCFRWQHCLCMGYKDASEIPDVYKCYYCDQAKWNKFDPAVCRVDTIQRLLGEKEPRRPKRKTLNSGEDRKRRKSEKDSKDRPGNEKRKSSNAGGGLPQTSSSSTFDINNKSNPLLQDGVCAELYQGVYYKLDKNDYKTLGVQESLAMLGVKFENNQPALSNVRVMSLAAYNTIKFSKIILPNYQKYLQERNELRRSKGCNETSIQVKTYSENPKQKFIGISKVGLFISRRDDSDDIIPVGTAVAEYLGEVDTMELYMANPVNQYAIWGTVKPHVARVDMQLSTDEPVSIVLDARFVGNESRFIRSSCPNTANCELRTYYIPELHEFKHVVYTTKEITLKGENMEEELRLNWVWDKNHPIRKMLAKNNTAETMKFEDFSDEEKVLLVSGVDTILNFVECACNTTSVNLQCAIFKIKKATSYLLRSTRKASNLTNTAFNKSKEELVMPKKSRPFVSWQERSAKRDKLLHQKIFSLDESDKSEDGLIGDDNDTTEHTSSPDGEEMPEGESLEHDAPRKLPYKQQLLKKKFVSRKYVTEHGDSVDLDKMSHIPKTVAIPLVSDILVSIKESVNESLKPLAKISSTVKIVPSESNLTKVSSEVDKETWKESSPIADVIAVAEPKQAPPIVKKLSFADYKKKMK